MFCRLNIQLNENFKKVQLATQKMTETKGYHFPFTRREIEVIDFQDVVKYNSDKNWQKMTLEEEGRSSTDN